jgi:XTP/dITP diphosphohydrolase
MLRFVTTNQGKVREAREYLDAVEQFDFDYPEIQSPDLAEIAAQGAREAYRAAAEPVIVDDAGLFIDAFDGFPGPYSSYTEDKLGIERVWHLTKEEDARRAAFKAVVAYCDGEPIEAAPDTQQQNETVYRGDEDDLPVKTFEGTVPGTIVEPRGDGGFGYDPIFEHDGTTFAEMTPEEKNAVSHRGRALAAFAEWYETNR